MDQRAVFIVVFLFTLISTVVVGTVSFVSGQSLIATVLYSLATMWVIGILSQVLLQSLYFSVVKPTEEEKLAHEEIEENPIEEINLEEVEEIDDLQKRLRGELSKDNDEEPVEAYPTPSSQDVRG